MHEFGRLAAAWYQHELFLERSLAVTADALHILVGMLVWLGSAMLFRKPVSHRLPWLVVLVAILFNEGVDMWIKQWPDHALHYGEGARDVLLTMMLPTLLMVAVRARPRLFR